MMMFAGRVGVAKPGECCAEWSCRALRRKGRVPLTFPFMRSLATPTIGPVAIKRRRGRPRRWFRWTGGRPL
jgi:hypothetical protein